MHGIGPPLVTPFTEDGDVDDAALRDLVGWVEARGVDFLVPCGSNSEAELMTADERARVVETVVDEASVPVLAGTGHPGRRETLQQTERAADAGADAALVITPFYYHHTHDALEAYYESVADESPLPVYLYSVPAYTDVALDPELVGRLSTHGNVHGMKDSSGSIDAFVRSKRATAEEDFDLLVGSGGVLAPALDAGGAGGVLALANVAPEAAAEVFRLHRAGDDDAARALNAELVELNRAVTAEYSVPGLKAAMRARGAPAGHVRSPHQPVGAETREELESLVDRLETLVSGF
ncbi:4-hydroxy-tetrahydrodipicolinate synthase [Halogranum gelatinilyticum]|uniref:4-hydroxy-tetrahydrodipicolinate synthase n=1 Tax=Halogranum gelatinilyticum TaxID=660521 RepID=A0A1G9XRU3_9EURY|nr:dihydrodipicolinate synthase family protein [Halogranum gelatinilyticum]SDM99440.1 4-hydroxy-tetrahydrodipicolinate synthase [Halogranum gelatinilyticum]